MTIDTAAPGAARATGALSPDAALTHPGTLLTPDGELVAPYDLERTGRIVSGCVAAAGHAGILSAARRPFRLDYARLSTVHVINGMGVALGDSVIGLTALAALRARHPRLRFVLYRPARAPEHVDALYRLAAGIVAPTVTLPQPVAALPEGDTRIDLGNHLYWPAFASQPMIDFFIAALGAEPRAIPADAKRNRWLVQLALPDLPPAWRARRYALFCPQASTPLRSIPIAQRAALVDRLADVYGLPVAGFGPVDHPRYTDVSAHSPDTAHFIAWAKHASVLLAGDSSAIHLAAGFDVPTIACFTSIAPVLRIRDYPRCVPVTLDVPARLRGLHRSERADDIAQVDAAYRALDWLRVAWPAARS